MYPGPHSLISTAALCQLLTGKSLHLSGQNQSLFNHILSLYLTKGVFLSAVDKLSGLAELSTVKNAAIFSTIIGWIWTSLAADCSGVKEATLLNLVSCSLIDKLFQNYVVWIIMRLNCIPQLIYSSSSSRSSRQHLQRAEDGVRSASTLLFARGMWKQHTWNN